jgi:E-phenylitaconyl-CoA hydratase
MSVLFEVRDHVAYLTINRPEVMNAMDPATYRALSERWIEVRDDPDIWVAIITGAGDKAFSAGADLRETIPRVPEIWEFWQTQKEPILNRGLEVWKPVIAAVNGYCLAGGMTLLLATDIRIAAEHARFGVPEVKRGILPANGGTQRLLRQIPYAIAMELLLTGDAIDAQEAYRIGLVNKVVPLAELMPTAEAVARRICANGPLAVRAIKELAVRSQSLPLSEGLRLEQAIAQVLRQTEDAQEGPRAFAEKRPPRYQGR